MVKFQNNLVFGRIRSGFSAKFESKCESRIHCIEPTPKTKLATREIAPNTSQTRLEFKLAKRLTSPDCFQQNRRTNCSLFMVVAHTLESLHESLYTWIIFLRRIVSMSHLQTDRKFFMCAQANINHRWMQLTNGSQQDVKWFTGPFDAFRLLIQWF